MLQSLFSKDHRFFSLKNIIKYVHNKPIKDLTLNFHLTVESFLIQSGMLSPGELFKKTQEIGENKLNLFFIKDLEEYKQLKGIKKGQLNFKTNCIFNEDGEPLIQLVPYESMLNFKLEPDIYSTIVIDEEYETLYANKEILDYLEKIPKNINILSVDGIKLMKRGVDEK